METMAKRRQKIIKETLKDYREFFQARGKEQIENMTDYYDWLSHRREASK